LLPGKESIIHVKREDQRVSGPVRRFRREEKYLEPTVNGNPGLAAHRNVIILKKQMTQFAYSSLSPSRTCEEAVESQ